MNDQTQVPNPTEPEADLAARLRADEERMLAGEQRMTADEARLAADETRLAADEKVLRTNRLVAGIAIALGVTLAIAMAGLTISLFALNRDIETVAKAAPKDDSVTTATLRDGAVTAGKLAPASVTSVAVADGGIGRADVGTAAIGTSELAPGAVAAADVRRNALTGAQIDERTLRGVASAQAAVRARTAGTAANAQALGGTAAGSYLSKITVVRAATATSGLRVKGPIAARCPAGMTIVSGGAAVDGTSRGVAIARSAPSTGDEWVAVASTYRRPAAPWRLVVTAVCVSGGGA
jgi:hypothetical protein